MQKQASSYLNEDGNMTRWTQVLEEKNFDRIKPGMHQDEVVSIIDESRVSNGIAFGRGYVWSWRYVNFHCNWFLLNSHQTISFDQPYTISHLNVVSGGNHTEIFVFLRPRKKTIPQSLGNKKPCTQARLSMSR